MTTKNKKFSRLTKALLETAEDMRDADIMTQDTYDKITMRHLGHKEKAEVEFLTGEITGKDVQLMREKARLSQAVFARYLNVTPGYVSKLERGEKRPTGSTVVLLNLIKQRGIDAVLGAA